MINYLNNGKKKKKINLLYPTDLLLFFVGGQIMSRMINDLKATAGVIFFTGAVLAIGAGFAYLFIMKICAGVSIFF